VAVFNVRMPGERNVSALAAFEVLIPAVKHHHASAEIGVGELLAQPLWPCGVSRGQRSLAPSAVHPSSARCRREGAGGSHNESSANHRIVFWEAEVASAHTS
jgi:hypothetical protein